MNKRQPNAARSLSGVAGGTSPEIESHESAISLDGLDDIFVWAQQTVNDGHNTRANQAYEQQIRRRVLALVQTSREERARDKVKIEVSYLQKRVIALLQAMQNSYEENSRLREILLSQQFALMRIPELEERVEKLQALEHDIKKSEEAQQNLMTALSKLKKDRDFLEELTVVNEKENARLSNLYNESRGELERLKARRWWHIFGFKF